MLCAEMLASHFLQSAQTGLLTKYKALKMKYGKLLELNAENALKLRGVAAGNYTAAQLTQVMNNKIFEIFCFQNCQPYF